ncbi:MAG: RluA family pseudouridine synthase [Chlamydiales bacterium]
MYTWVAHSEERLLSFVKKKLNKLTTKELRWAIEHNRCRVNGLVERFASYHLKQGDQVVLSAEKRKPFKYDPLFEDESLLVYNKPANIDSLSLSEQLNGYLVHRLDRDTTGALLLAKNREMKKKLESLFRKRTIHKHYLAIIEGHPKKSEGTIEAFLASIKKREGTAIWGVVPKSKGVWSKTTWQLEERGEKSSLISCFPYTGRTHQIRVHLKTTGHPVLGDVEYGGFRQPNELFRPLLHAYQLSFTHPDSMKEMSFTAPLPIDFESWCKKCRFKVCL